MKRSLDEATHETPRARYEDALRHEGREAAAKVVAPRHMSRRHPEPSGGEPADSEDSARVGLAAGSSTRSSSRGRLDNRFESRLERRAGEEKEGENPGSARLQAARQRHAKQRMRATTMLLVIPTTVFSVMLMAMAHVVFRDWRSYESEASIAHAQLSALQEQLDTGQSRLNSLQSPKGREQILVEHGFIRPGDRMLLFPSEATPEQSTVRTQNDIAARRAIHNAVPSSAWDRAARTMTGWIGHLSGAPATPAPAAPDISALASSTSAPNAAPATPEADAAGDSNEALSPADRIVRPQDDASH